MDYPIKTLSQLRPILVAFRKSAGMTQAMMASRLGVAQQTYAQLEANPASASLERLFKVLSVLNVDLTLSQRDLRLGTIGHTEQTLQITRSPDRTGGLISQTAPTQPVVRNRRTTHPAKKVPQKPEFSATPAKVKSKVAAKHATGVAENSGF